MSEGSEFLLTKAAGHVEAIRSQYSQLVEEAVVDDELLYSVKSAIEDLNSALDWTANAVAAKYGIPGRRTYYPIAASQDEFPGELKKQLGDLQARHPAVADAFERHQPYQDGKTELGYLRKLTRINKHHDFTPQRRDEFRLVNFYVGGMLLASLGKGFHIGGRPEIVGQLVNPQVAESEGGEMRVLDATVVDWHFVDPPVSVLATLESLLSIAREAIVDVRTAAGFA